MLLVAGLALCAVPPGALAQGALGADSVRILGGVVDQATGVALSDATVSIVVRAARGEAVRVVWTGVTDSTGVFHSKTIQTGQYGIIIEALGYRTADEDVDLTGARAMDISVELVPEPLELEPLVVVSRRQSRLETSGFYERRRMGQGYSLTREEIEAHRPMLATDVFRRIPGVRLMPSRLGNLVNFRGCTPDVIVDGTPLSGPVPIDDILAAEDLEAVEVFSSAYAPIAVSRSQCGVVMIWTREGRHNEQGNPLTWKRVLAAVGFIAFAIFMTR